MERLQKIIAQAGIASRRAAEKLIAAGQVAVDGRIVTELGYKVDWPRQKITVEGKNLAAAEKNVYFILNKPYGYISTTSDDRGRKTVLDLLPDIKERIYPVGRLDYDTEGLILLTNDGKLMNGLLHPRYEVEKTYIASVKGSLEAEKINRLRDGIALSDGMTAPARVIILPKSRPPDYLVEMTIHEGRNRQVRRMLEAVGCKVESLRRVRFAGLTLKGLKNGEKRQLTAEEIACLKKLAGISG